MRMIGHSRPTDPPLPVESAEASDLMSVLEVDRLHHLGRAVPFGFGSGPQTTRAGITDI